MVEYAQDFVHLHVNEQAIFQQERQHTPTAISWLERVQKVSTEYILDHRLRLVAVRRAMDSDKWPKSMHTHFFHDLGHNVQTILHIYRLIRHIQSIASQSRTRSSRHLSRAVYSVAIRCFHA